MSRSVKMWKCTSSGNRELDYVLAYARAHVPDHLKKNYYRSETDVCWTYINDKDLIWCSAVQHHSDWDWDVAGILRRVYSSGTLENEFMDIVIANQARAAREDGFQRLFVATHKNIPRYFMGQTKRWERLTGDEWHCDGRRYWVRHCPQLLSWTGECPHEPVLD